MDIFFNYSVKNYLLRVFFIILDNIKLYDPISQILTFKMKKRL